MEASLRDRQTSELEDGYTNVKSIEIASDPNPGRKCWSRKVTLISLTALCIAALAVAGVMTGLYIHSRAGYDAPLQKSSFVSHGHYFVLNELFEHKELISDNISHEDMYNMTTYKRYGPRGGPNPGIWAQTLPFVDKIQLKRICEKMGLPTSKTIYQAYEKTGEFAERGSFPVLEKAEFMEALERSDKHFILKPGHADAACGLITMKPEEWANSKDTMWEKAQEAIGATAEGHSLKKHPGFSDPEGRSVLVEERMYDFHEIRVITVFGKVFAGFIIGSGSTWRENSVIVSRGEKDDLKDWEFSCKWTSKECNGIEKQVNENWDKMVNIAEAFARGTGIDYVRVDMFFGGKINGKKSGPVLNEVGCVSDIFPRHLKSTWKTRMLKEHNNVDGYVVAKFDLQGLSLDRAGLRPATPKTQIN